MASFTMVRNDTAPPITATLTDSAGTAIDLSGATVRFHMVDSAGAVKVDAACTVTSATGGVVSYSWAAADTDTSGSYKAEWEVTFSDGTIRTFPSPSKTMVRIVGDLA